jgi:hypothetical protein
VFCCRFSRLQMLPWYPAWCHQVGCVHCRACAYHLPFVLPFCHCSAVTSSVTMQATPVLAHSSPSTAQGLSAWKTHAQSASAAASSIISDEAWAYHACLLLHCTCTRQVAVTELPSFCTPGLAGYSLHFPVPVSLRRPHKNARGLILLHHPHNDDCVQF